MFKLLIFCLLFALYFSVPQTCIDGGVVTLEEEQDLGFSFRSSFRKFASKIKKVVSHKTSKKRPQPHNKQHIQRNKKKSSKKTPPPPRKRNNKKNNTQKEHSSPKSKYKCDPKTTCRYNCRCGGQAIYLNLFTWSSWNSPQVKSTWNSLCSGKQSAHEYIDQLKRDPSFSNLSWLKSLAPVFKYVIDRYERLCRGGKPLSPEDYQKLYQYFMQNARSKVKRSVTRQHGESDDFGPAFEFQLDEHLMRVFTALLQKLRSHNFEHCDCKTFFRALGYNTKHPQYQGLERACRKKCSANTLTLEFEN
eukprot:gene9011-1110_t